MNSTHPRIGVRAAVFALMLLVASLALLAWQDARIVSAHTADSVERARAVQALVERQQGDDLTQRAGLIASDAAFSDYVGQALGGALPGVPVDTTSIIDLLAERQQQLKVSLAAVIDGSGRVIAQSGLDPQRETVKADPVFERARRSLTVATGLWEQDGQLLHAAVMPLAALGSSDGFLVVALPVQRDFAQAIATASGADVTLLHASRDGPAIVASTLPASNDDVLDAVRGGSTPGALLTVSVDGDPRRALTSQVLGSDAGTLVLMPKTAALAAMTRASRVPWLIGTLVLALGLGLAGWWIARMVVRPVSEIADRLDRAASGDVHLQFLESEAGAMTGLAAAFNRMTASLRR